LPRFFQWNQGDRDSEFVLELRVHLMLCDPQREDRDLDRKVIDLNAVEVLDVDPRLREEDAVLGVKIGESFEDGVLELAQLLVRDDEEVPGSTGRVEDLDRADAFEECLELFDRI